MSHNSGCSVTVARLHGVQEASRGSTPRSPTLRLASLAQCKLSLTHKTAVGGFVLFCTDHSFLPLTKLKAFAI
ncbi:MAG: hypothetical protein UU70_C0011G0005 [Candidatus Yanofskybacteria bacterium GW2011_GWA1_41_6]|uniref:Uncharacterized protein n=1 Tax=Candidatus Yanofskybacteria bacterium GW2011_GWA1_41_6 TaxID=1619020 RepID=A0A0G0ZL81_9BACT|nr:MAG: hypothetical protein UU70_C0011G0005 [Candidatus Yanofskybacteria bacterium GW2011_GWA1_41_6]